jgi:hypothetical protein
MSTLRVWRRVAISLVLALVAAGIVTAQSAATKPSPSARILDCQSAFGPSVSAADLSARYGRQNVVSEKIYLGEGESEEGTVLLATSPADRVEIRLLGFDWDYGGTERSWPGGRYDRREGGRRVRARFEVRQGSRSTYWREVEGDREFSSGHPAMQELNPRVDEILLVYP